MESLHLITIRENASSNIHASGAKVAVRIAGQSFFTGNEALKKAAEVANLISALKERGITEEQVHLLHVATEVESGILTKTSSATYDLLVECTSIDLLGRVLSTVSLQKNSKIIAVSWEYPDLPKIKRELIQKAVYAAKDAARAVADSLAVSLLGVHKLSYDILGLDTEVRIPARRAHGIAVRKKASTKEQLESLHLSHTTTVEVTVTAEFIVDTFNPNRA